VRRVVRRKRRQMIETLQKLVADTRFREEYARLIDIRIINAI
jgi:hypothetical protein